VATGITIGSEEVLVPRFPRSIGEVELEVTGVEVLVNTVDVAFVLVEVNEGMFVVEVALVDVAFVLVEVNEGMFVVEVALVDVAVVELAVGSFRLNTCVLVALVELAVVVVIVVVPKTSVLEAVTVTVTGLVDVETVVTGTGGATTIGGIATGSVEVAEVDVAVVIGSIVGKTSGVVVAVVSGATVTGTGPPVRCLLNQYATAATPSDHEAKVVIEVPVFPTFPGLNVDAPVPAVPRRESSSIIAIVSLVSTAYLVVASITI